MPSKYEKFDMQTMRRTEINNAPYNPRVMDAGAKKRLKEGLKKHGLVQPLTWNKRTGHLVSGHQRLEQLDALEGTQNYELNLAVIDVDEAEEKKINVQMNNPSMMGEWDIDALKEIALDISMPDLGFTESDAAILFGDDERFESFMRDTSDVTEAKSDLNDIKRNRAEYAEQMKGAQSASFYFTVVCESKEEKAQLLKDMKIPEYEEYVSSGALRRLCQ